MVDVSDSEVSALMERIVALEARLAGAAAACPTLQQTLLTDAERLADMGSYVWDVKTDRIEWSDNLFRLFGVEPHSLEPRLGWFLSKVHPDDIAALMTARRRVRDSGQTVECVYRATVAHRGMRWFRLRAVWRRQGDDDKVIGVVHDITRVQEQKRSQAHVLKLIDAIERIGKAGVWEWNLSNDQMIWSPGLFRLFGYPPQVMPTIERYWDIVHPEDQRRVREVVDQTVADGGTTGPTEYRVVTRGGEVKSVLGNLHVIRESGDETKLVGVMADLSEVKRLENEVHQAQKMEALGRLAGGVAHDFNNLLMAIMGNAQLLALTSPSEEIEDILTATRDAAALTTQLLAFSHSVPSEPRVVNLNDTCHMAAKLLRRVLGEDVALSMVLAPNLPSIRADSTQLNQILMNLAVNAKDAMPDGGRLSVMTDTRTLSEDNPHGLRDGRYVALSVRDDGVGMSDEVRARAFEPFFTTKEGAAGTGLGLSAVFGIAKQCRGTVSLDSVPDRGTTVTVLFPAVATAAQGGERDGACAPPRGQGQRVLVVEDAYPVRRVLTRILSDAGYRVVAAGEAAEAIAAWRRAQGGFDLLVTDVVMPGMRGPELARRLREEVADLRVLFVTGYAPHDARIDGHLLLKPVRPDTLLQAVHAALSSSESPQTARR